MVLIKIKHLLKFPEIDHIVDMTESLIDMKQKGGEVEATTVKVIVLIHMKLIMEIVVEILFTFYCM